MSERTNKNSAIEIRSKQTTNIVLMLSSTYFAQSCFRKLGRNLKDDLRIPASQAGVLPLH